MRSGVHKPALVVSFLLGGWGIVWLKIDEGGTDWAPALWSVAVIAAYAAIAWALRRDGARSQSRHDPEAAGDNCYYLGFVFTLVSLAVTLYRLAPPGANAQLTSEAIPQVISGFGIALASTIVGIALRVLHLRMAADPGVLSRDAQGDLEIAVAGFRDNLVASNQLLRDFAIETAQILSEQRDDARKRMEETEAAHRKALAASVEAHMTVIGAALGPATDKAVAAIAESVAEVTDSARRELSERVAELARQEAETVESLVDGAERAAKQLARFESVVADLAARLDVVGAGMSGRLDPAAWNFNSSVSRAVGALASSEAALTELAGSLDSARARLSDRFAPATAAFDARVLGTAEALSASEAALATFTARLETLRASMSERTGPDFGAGVDRVLEALRASDAAFSELARGLDAAGGGLSNRLDPAILAFHRGASDAAEALVKANAVVNETADKLVQLTDDIESHASAGLLRRVFRRVTGRTRG